PIRVSHGAVDTLAHLTSLPGYTYLPETEVPPKSWRPMGLALVYTGIALAGTSALSNGDLGSASLREGGAIGGGIVLAGFIMRLRKPAPQPARGNILYNLLLGEPNAGRNTSPTRTARRPRRLMRPKWTSGCAITSPDRCLASWGSSIAESIRNSKPSRWGRSRRGRRWRTSSAPASAWPCAAA